MQCEECEEGPEASWKCADCNSHFCDDCHAHHRRSKKTSSHTTVPFVSSPMAVPPAPVCSPDCSPAKAEGMLGKRVQGLVGIDGVQVGCDAQGETSCDNAPHVPALDSLQPALHAFGPDGMRCSVAEARSAPLPQPGGACEVSMLVWKVRVTRGFAPVALEQMPKTPHAKGKLKALFASKKKVTTSKEGWLGLDMCCRCDGHVVIAGLHPTGPASGRPCLMVGDILIGIGNSCVRYMNPTQLKQLTSGPPGSPVDITLGLQSIPGLSFIGFHVLEGGYTVLVERVQRHAEGIIGVGPIEGGKAVEISVGKTAQLSAGDLAAVTKTFDLCKLGPMSVGYGAMNSAMQTPPSSKKNSHSPPAAASGTSNEKLTQSAISSASDTPRSGNMTTPRNESLGNVHVVLTNVQLMHLQEARKFLDSTDIAPKCSEPLNRDSRQK